MTNMNAIKRMLDEFGGADLANGCSNQLVVYLANSATDSAKNDDLTVYDVDVRKDVFDKLLQRVASFASGRCKRVALRQYRTAELVCEVPDALDDSPTASGNAARVFRAIVLDHARCVADRCVALRVDRAEEAFEAFPCSSEHIYDARLVRRSTVQIHHRMCVHFEESDHLDVSPPSTIEEDPRGEETTTQPKSQKNTQTKTQTKTQTTKRKIYFVYDHDERVDRDVIHKLIERYMVLLS